MKNLLLLFLICISVSVTAQSLSPYVVASTGNFKITGGFSLSSTVGEPVTTTVAAGNFILTQGFQQQSLKGVGVQNVAMGNLDIRVFPNPATEEVNVLIFSPDASATMVKLFDVLGRELAVPASIINEGTQKQFTLHLTQLSASMYFIAVYDLINHTTQTIKIQKVTL
jgi:hypothetical protein